MNKLFIFGFGYVSQFLADALKKQNWEIAGTTRDPIKALTLKRWGYQVYSPEEVFESVHILNTYSHILYSIPPLEEEIYIPLLKNLDLKWLGYLSSTSVYGDHQGAFVDENTSLKPLSLEGKNRVVTEELFSSINAPLHIFRLSGIYGPHRNALASVMAGKAQRIDKPGHFLSRIHVEDICQALIASMNHPTPQQVFNLSDSHPCASREVIEYACTLLDRPFPDLISYGDDVSPNLKRFYMENRRIRNDKALETLNLTLKYPTYKEGLDALINEGL